MILHIFNPEHDIALATNQKHFIAPHAARQLKADLSYLPAIYADNTELILVDDLVSATNHLRHFQKFTKHCHLISANVLETIKDDITEVRPWGWDSAVKQQMIDHGISEKALPSDQYLDHLRQISNRQFSARILYELTHSFSDGNLIGTATHITDPTELRLYLRMYKQSIVKAPWSSSGRGIRYIDYENLDDNLFNWAVRVIQKQGGIMIEPYYNKVKDFGMEFTSYGNRVKFEGLSLFETTNGAYGGNLLETEQNKSSILTEYLDENLVATVALKLERLLEKYLKGDYIGPLGVDMMIVPNPKKDSSGQHPFLLHPMVELNLRSTMGHVALALSQHAETRNRNMQIDFDGSHYHLHLINKGDVK